MANKSVHNAGKSSLFPFYFNFFFWAKGTWKPEEKLPQQNSFADTLYLNVNGSEQNWLQYSWEKEFKFSDDCINGD